MGRSQMIDCKIGNRIGSVRKPARDAACLDSAGSVSAEVARLENLVIRVQRQTRCFSRPFPLFTSRRFLLAPTSHRSSPSVNSTSDPDASARDPASRRRLLSKLNRNLIDSRVMEVNSTNFRPHPPYLPARNARDREENFLDNDYSRRDEPRLYLLCRSPRLSSQPAQGGT